jgi:hypothetical protein
VQKHVRIDGDGDREREGRDEPGRRARARLAEGEPGERGECERQERQRAHRLVLGDRPQGADRHGEGAGEARRPGDGQRGERER